jgi:hypothetical protein
MQNGRFGPQTGSQTAVFLFLPFLKRFAVRFTERKIRVKEEKKTKKPTPKNSPTYKTKEDFMRWYYKQDAYKKKMADEE